ncbi:MAG TPA: hypothetical protein VNW50_16240 [Streptosporangiaceae bacterium]|nr:hypothetical protein [Streptosporangiaceae bacterium]
MNPAWWAAFGPADASLRCGDGEHRLRWAEGTLQARDHPDAEGELVLGALGGDTSPCLDLVIAWGKHSDDLTVLAIGPRSASDLLTIPAAILAEVTAVSGPAGPLSRGPGNPAAHTVSIGGTVSQHSSAAFYVGRSGRSPRRVPRPMPARALAWRRTRMLRGHAGYGLVSGWHGHPGWHGAEIDQARAELIRLLALGGPFQFRLSAAVAHAWSADGANAGRPERARPALTAALAGRLAPAAAEWLDVDPDEVEVNVHDGAGWGELALTKPGKATRLQARLPVGWLASVWAPGFAVVDGHLVVSVLDAAWPTAQVLAVRSPGQDPAELAIRDDKGHWSVTVR